MSSMASASFIQGTYNGWVMSTREVGDKSTKDSVESAQKQTILYSYCPRTSVRQRRVSRGSDPYESGIGQRNSFKNGEICAGGRNGPLPVPRCMVILGRIASSVGTKLRIDISNSITLQLI